MVSVYYSNRTISIASAALDTDYFGYARKQRVLCFNSLVSSSSLDTLFNSDIYAESSPKPKLECHMAPSTLLVALTLLQD